MLLVLDQLKNLLGLQAMGDAHDHFLQRFWLHAVEGGRSASRDDARSASARSRWCSRCAGSRRGSAAAASRAADRGGRDGGRRRRGSVSTQRGVTVIGEIPAKLPPFRPARLRRGADSRVLDRRARDRAARPARSHRDGQGDRGPDPAEARHEPAVPERRARELHRLASSSASRVGLAHALGDQSAGRRGDAMVGRRVGDRGRADHARLRALRALHPARRARRHPDAVGVADGRLGTHSPITCAPRASTPRSSPSTAFSAVAISIEFCVLIGVFMSFLLTVPRAGRMLLTEFVVSPDGSVHERLPDDEACGRILIFGLEGEMFFGATSALEMHLETIEERVGPDTSVVVLRMKRLHNADAVGLALIDGFRERMAARGVRLVLCGVRKPLFDTMKRTRPGRASRGGGRLPRTAGAPDQHAARDPPRLRTDPRTLPHLPASRARRPQPQPPLRDLAPREPVPGVRLFLVRLLSDSGDPRRPVE